MKKVNTLRIIFSKNPNCSGYGMYYVFGAIIGVATLISLVFSSLLEFFTRKVSSESREQLFQKIKKYIKFLALGSVTIYIILAFLSSLLARFFDDSYRNIISSIEIILLLLIPIFSLILSLGVVSLFIFADFLKARPFLKFLLANLSFLFTFTFTCVALGFLRVLINILVFFTSRIG